MADRARTSAPTISAYEHGARQPRADVLLRLLDAAGVEPTLVPARPRSHRYVDLLCDAIAAHVRRDPDVLGLAKRELARTRKTDNTRAWRHLIAAGPAAVVTVLTSRDPEADGLKADNPFARLGLVDEPTRLALVDEAHGR